jgi:sugar O-acyltransferase (sialic acid O-acetyltransferase NeuD family)
MNRFVGVNARVHGAWAMNRAVGVVVIGGGGHAKVVISTLRGAGCEVAAVFDDAPASWGARVSGVEVLGPVKSIPEHPYHFGVIAVGDNRVRREIAGRVDLRWLTAVHPGAYVDPSARVGPGAVVFAGAVVQPGAVVGDHAIVNSGAVVDHDCEVGRFAHVAPGVILAGAVRVGEGALLGVGTSVTPGVRIGAWSTVGAGSVVVRDLPDGVVAFGSPARPRTRP